MLIFINDWYLSKNDKNINFLYGNKLANAKFGRDRFVVYNWSNSRFYEIKFGYMITTISVFSS